MIDEGQITSEVAHASRRVPAQQRSRERLERILAAASDLIATKGSDALRMSDVAGRAGISIGSLYQYFPDKSAIIRTLAERFNEASRTCIRDAFAPVCDLEGLGVAYLQLVDLYYSIVLAEPVMRDIWSGMQADKDLTALELVESRLQGALLAETLVRVRPEAEPGKLATTAFLVWRLGEAAVRLAISLDREEGDAIIATFKHMSVRELLTD